ncbi:hypothetical protein HELRODRAFT_183618 [Helobdella robusta]|uniref:Uncharacterized protein n=1 Tax=Helobdella robusta TaxID=6412 RepID=T1FJY0_HELRO|nr:hypothetical protein HELRODRAFT_183618 [Helobdella robusta]ESO10461.1 hypothetical protein HELRODRAFT_183618 [Helobdella robusta]
MVIKSGSMPDRIRVLATKSGPAPARIRVLTINPGRCRREYDRSLTSWRKINELGLSATYKQNENIRHFVGMVDGLAFLRIQDVEEGIIYLLNNIPNNDDDIRKFVNYFDEFYCRGKLRIVPGNNPLTILLRRTPPVFPPELWNMNEITVSGNARTNNICEGWNSSFRSLVGHSNPSIWNLLRAFQLDRSMNINAFNQLQEGRPTLKKTSQHTINHQRRLRNICNDLNNEFVTIPIALQAIGHTILLTRDYDYI